MARLVSNIMPMLSENHIANLHSRKIYTAYDFMSCTSDDLMQFTGLSFREVESIKKSFFEKFGGQATDAIDFYQQEKDVLPSGITNLDDLLGGGFHYRKIYEICGASSSGKSQLCLWVAIQATLNKIKVHYIDCSRNFNTSRIQMILESKQCSDIIIAQVMSNIVVHQISTINDLFTILHHLSEVQNEDQMQLSRKLVIVDSISVFCTTIVNNHLNPILTNFASVCRFIVNNCYTIVINVNTIKILHDGEIFTDEDKVTVTSIKPSMGKYWLTVPNVRLLISCTENVKREISVWKSCQLENGKKCLVDIKDEGFI